MSWPYSDPASPFPAETSPDIEAAAHIQNPEPLLEAIQHLVASSEPAVVFSSLARSCVPAFSDECRVDVVQDGAVAYRIRYPQLDPASDAHPGGVTRTRPRRQLSIDFDVRADGDADACYSGVVTFTWNRNIPGTADLVIAQLLTDRAIAVIHQERQRAAADQDRATVVGLKAGLISNRQIGTAMGILMATHKITEPAAFDLLRTASQRAHRKMRDIAEEVVQTGWLEEVQTGTRHAKPDTDPQGQMPSTLRSSWGVTEGCRGSRTR